MNDLENLFSKNEAWANQIKSEDPTFFERLSKQQSPEYLWIGCSDSRVPANQLVGLMPGEMFVHRNIANCVVHTDLNCLSVIFYAVHVLKVKHVIVCGHYGCGGVQAALTDQQFGLVDHWIRNIRDVYHKRHEEILSLSNDTERLNRLCELNVEQQVANVCHIPVIQNAWHEGRELSIHGWIYDIGDGRLKEVTKTINGLSEVSEQFRLAPEQ